MMLLMIVDCDDVLIACDGVGVLEYCSHVMMMMSVI
jgi:hypothetical protein